jgi:bacteriocin-like protein
MESVLILDNNKKNNSFSSNLSLLDKNELKSINGGSPKALAGWKAAVFLGGGTLLAIGVAIGATYLIVKGVRYLAK